MPMAPEGMVPTWWLGKMLKEVSEEGQGKVGAFRAKSRGRIQFRGWGCKVTRQWTTWDGKIVAGNWGTAKEERGGDIYPTSQKRKEKRQKNCPRGYRDGDG